MSYMQFQQKCNDCGFSWNAAFGIVGTTYIAQPPEKCPSCSSINIFKCADGWTNPESPIDWKSLAEKAEADREQLQVQLAGCDAAALGATKDPAIVGQWGWSAAYQNVLELRIRCEKAEAEKAQLQARVEELSKLVLYWKDRCDLDEQRIADLEQQLKQAGEVQLAAKAFIDRLDVIHADEHYKSVWSLYMIHGGDYSNGPKYDTEMSALRAAIEAVNKEGK